MYWQSMCTESDVAKQTAAEAVLNPHKKVKMQFSVILTGLSPKLKQLFNKKLQAMDEACFDNHITQAASPLNAGVNLVIMSLCKQWVTH
jgi:hypothetical protein